MLIADDFGILANSGILQVIFDFLDFLRGVLLSGGVPVKRGFVQISLSFDGSYDVLGLNVRIFLKFLKFVQLSLHFVLI